MLRVVIFSFIFNWLNDCVACPQHKSCPVSSPEEARQVVETMKKDTEFQSFLADALQQKEAILKDAEFQDFVADLQAQMQESLPRPSQPKGKPGDLYIFVSFSLSEKALLNLANEAKPYGATLVLRGFIEESYAKTVQALQNIIVKTGQGFIIDPELFSLFSVTAVPTYVLAKPFQLSAQMRTQSPLHDRLQGHVSVSYALETFAQSGDLREEAQALLNRRRIK